MVPVHAGGWFSLMLAGIYAVLMLLTGWGNIQKGRFFKRNLIPNLEQYVSVMREARKDNDTDPLKEQLCLVAPPSKQVMAICSNGIGMLAVSMHLWINATSLQPI